MVSHEMRTPLLSIIFFLNNVLKLLSKLKTKSDKLKKAKHFTELVLNQVNFVLSFVEDLLDLQLMRTGKLKLTNEVFDPIEIFSNIFKIFEP